MPHIVELRALALSDQSIASITAPTRCRDLGPLSFHEVAVLVVFCLLVLLWFFRFFESIHSYNIQNLIPAMSQSFTNKFVLKETWIYPWVGYSTTVGRKHVVFVKSQVESSQKSRLV